MEQKDDEVTRFIAEMMNFSKQMNADAVKRYKRAKQIIWVQMITLLLISIAAIYTWKSRNVVNKHYQFLDEHLKKDQQLYMRLDTLLHLQDSIKSKLNSIAPMVSGDFESAP